MSFEETNNVTTVIREYPNVSTALIGFRHHKGAIPSGVSYPRAEFKVYASEPDTIDDVSPETTSWTDVTGGNYRGAHVWRAYNSEIDRDPTDYVLLSLSADDGSGVRTIDHPMVAMSAVSGVYDGYDPLDSIEYMGKLNNYKQGFCVNLLATGDCSFKLYDKENRALFLFSSASDVPYEFGVGADETVTDSNGNMVPYFIGRTSGPDYFAKVTGLTGFPSYTPKKMWDDLVYNKKINCISAISAFNAYLEQVQQLGSYNYVSSGDYVIKGNFGYVAKEVDNADEDTVFDVDLGPYPYVLVNTAKSSYYIEGSGTVRTTVTDATGAALTAYIPSYRFSYEYTDTSDPFTQHVRYVGKRPVPVKRVNDERIDEALSLCEAGAVVDDSTYVSKKQYLDNCLYCRQWPCVNTTEGQRSGDLKINLNDGWMAFLDNVSYLPDDNSGDSDEKFFKDGNFHFFNVDTSVGISLGKEYIYPNVFADEDMIKSCVNGVAQGENGTIRMADENSMCMNLFRIKSFRFDTDEIATNGNQVSAYYSLKWVYTGMNGSNSDAEAARGKIKIRRVNGGNTYAVYSDGYKEPVTGDIPIIRAANSTLKQICIVNQKDVTFDAFSVSSDFRSFVDTTGYGNAVKTDINNFFNSYDRVLFGSELYLGETGLFDQVETPINFDSIGDQGLISSESGDDTIVYNVFDSIDLDVSVRPKIDSGGRTAMRNIGIGDGTILSIPDILKSGWYLWIDKTSVDYPVNPNIKIEVLDCKGLTDDGEWIDCDIPDVSEAANVDGVYVVPESASIDSIFETNAVNFNRMKIRYRLVCNGSETPLSSDGYSVYLGYSIKNSKSGETKDFPKIHGNTINPIVNGCEDVDGIEVTNGREYRCVVDGRCDDRSDLYGIVYGNGLSSSNKVSVVFGVDGVFKKIDKWIPDAKLLRRMWNIDSIENENSVLNVIVEPETADDERLYYIGASWTEYNKPIKDGVMCNVYHRIGTYFKSKTKNNFYFDVGNSEFKFYDSIGWDDNGYHYSEVTLPTSIGTLDVSTAEYSSRVKDGLIRLFNIDESMGSDSIGFFVDPTVNGERYVIRVGDEGDPIEISSNDAKKLSIDKSKMKTDPIMGWNIRLIIANSSISDDDIPLTYSLMDDSDGIVVFGTGYYEAFGGINIGFRDYKYIGAVVRVVTSPTLSEGAEFYIVNGFKNFCVGTTCNFGGSQTDPNNNINLIGTKTLWTTHLIENFDDPDKRKLAWSSPEGYLSSVNANKAIIRLTADDSGEDVDRIRYKTINNSLVFEGRVVFTYDIKIGGTTRMRVTDEYPSRVNGSFDPIWVCSNPVLYFMSNVVTYRSPIFIMNDTDNEISDLPEDSKARKIFSEYKISTDHGEEWSIDADSKTWVVCGDFTSDVEIIAYASGKLAGDWLKNDEKIEYAISSTQLVLHVINGKDYDESITRVVGGHKLVYPHSRESILFSPNEWLTADNMNLRFKRITENLKYFENNTKFYLRPPTMYCGYYGDFEAVVHGTYDRVYGGFVENGSKQYRKCGENDSIDDENTFLRGCVSIATAKPFLDDCKVDSNGHLISSAEDTDVDNNLYVCLGDKIRILGQTSYYENSARYDIVPKRTNELIDTITRIFYSNETNLLYCLAPKTHKVYMFNRYKHNSTGEGDPQNASYYGEIGGYGGLIAHSKFNKPNDLFISSIRTGDGGSTDEIWVCDAGNRCIKHFSIKGQWINTIDLSAIEFDLRGVCVDYKNRVHVLTDNYVFTFTSDGDIIRAFGLRSNGDVPIMIRPQFMAGFLYVLYEHRVAKYSFDGDFIGNFAENDVLSYTCMCPSKEHDLYIGTNKNILLYNDSLRIATIGATRNAHDFCWTLNEIYLNKNENVQDSVLTTSLQRMYDNIMMFSICTFGHVMDNESINADGAMDFDKSTMEELFKLHHKERIFVGVNELVTMDVLNRSLGQMCDLLDLMLKSI